MMKRSESDRHHEIGSSLPGIANVFPSRPLLEPLPQTPINNSSAPPPPPPNFQRILTGATVAVFRDQPPPLAHGSVTLKAESLTLPNTPVQYTNNFSPATVTPLKNLPITSNQILHGKSAATIRTITATPASISTASSGIGVNSGNAQFQRLKVEDALSYLDQVKYKFGNQPQVYNDFLDIMKEFKSQSIDTPGVITRVSCLFRGHPELIVGFNTFLPPGYKIEVQCNDSITVNMAGLLGPGMQTIVHTPTGIHTMGVSGHMSAITTSSPLVAQNSLMTHQSSGAASVAIRPVTVTHPTKFPQPTFKQENNHPSSVHMFQQQQQHHHQQQQIQQQPLSPHLTSTPPQNGPNVSSQPVEFNHAINYVNKIKNRFQGQPDVYKQFLEILHTYQKDQKAIKEGIPPSVRHLTEAEVYSQVSKLFQNQEDLLSEFGQFLPEATNDNATSAIMLSNKGLNNDHISIAKKPMGLKSSVPPSNVSNLSGISASTPQSVSTNLAKYGGVKRPVGGTTNHPPPKKPKMGVLRDVTLAEAGKFGTLNEYAFFDKVRKALRNPDVYDNFLRCLTLFNQEVISRCELVQLSTPFLNKHPELFKWFKDFLGHKDGILSSSLASPPSPLPSRNCESASTISNTSSSNTNSSGRDRGVSGESALEIDYATCKRLGASYCALPENAIVSRSSGRTLLCREVLNDTWVSFPSWSEDSQFVTSRKTQFEEFIYRTEDERFEFDVVLETNKDTIRVLECVQKKMCRMPPEEAARYNLDDSLGGTSATIHQRTIRRIYGDKAFDIIEGLKRNPVVAVPIVLKRLRQKDEEWREVQKTFNKVWRDQNEKYYLKSLDHQALHFKQSDIRNLRSKSLLTEIETLYDERHEQEESTDESIHGPHLVLDLSYPPILDDANNLLIHHVKRQTSIHKGDKQRIKVLLKQFYMDLFRHPRQELSDDEREDENEREDEFENERNEKEGGTEETEKDKGEKETENGGSESNKNENSKLTRSERVRKARGEDSKHKKVSSSNSCKSNNNNINNSTTVNETMTIKNTTEGRKTPLIARNMEADETYTHMLCNNNWYLFIRLHHLLCERLTKMYNQAIEIATAESEEKRDRKESTAVALRLKPKNEIDAQDYYPAYLDMIKNVLDGNMEAQTFEDTLREMFGIHAYTSFTIDKVITNAVRQLQHLASDETCIECQELYNCETKNNGTGGLCSTAIDRQIHEILYQKRAEKLLSDENCMKVVIYHLSSKITIEMLDAESESVSEESTQKWHKYIERFIQPGEDVSKECKAHLTLKPVFLPRGIRSYRKSPFGKMKMSNTICEASRSGASDDSLSKETSSSSTSTNTSETLGRSSMNKSRSSVVYEDNLQCNFNPRNFKVLYVIKSETSFYRCHALRRAKESHKKVSQRKTRDFNRWHSDWLRNHVTDHSHQFVTQWFNGLTEGLVPNNTHKVVKNNYDITPYRTYYKWKEEESLESH